MIVMSAAACNYLVLVIEINLVGYGCFINFFHVFILTSFDFFLLLINQEF